jgi:hypothetical protein
MKLGADKNGLVVPFPGSNGEVRRWVEVAPFVWRDPDSHERIAAKVVDGRVVRFSFDELSPFMVFDRAPWYTDSAWLLPLLIAAMMVLLVTAIRWPVAALVRRHYGATLTLERPALRAYRWSRIAAVALLTAMLLWGLTLGVLLSNINQLSARSDSVLRLLQLFGAVAFVVGPLVMLWNAWVVWRGRRRWPARTWSIALVVSALVVTWVAIAFRLLSFGLNY